MYLVDCSQQFGNSDLLLKMIQKKTFMGQFYKSSYAEVTYF